jgi:hypothetical protein
MSKSSSFKDMPAGRPSGAAPADRSAFLAGLAQDVQAEEVKRVNFDLRASLHQRLKVAAARRGLSVKDFLTVYVESLPD